MSGPLSVLFGFLSTLSQKKNNGKQNVPSVLLATYRL